MLSPHLPVPTRILSVQTENSRTKTFVFDAQRETGSAGYCAAPGQFLMAWLPRFDEKPFSLVDDDPLTITVAAVGPFTALFHRLQAGDKVWLRGPFGRGFQTEGNRLLLVGGGYGVAPLSFLARRAVAAGQPVTVVIGAGTAEELLFVQRLERQGAEVRVTTEDGSRGAQGLVTAEVEPLLAAGLFNALYACGPHGMLEALARLSGRYQVPAQLSWEAYMRCGLGLCGSCEKDGRILCLDGPVIASQ